MPEYIEREAALDVVNGWREQLIPTYGKNDEYVKCLETVAEHLESLHAADVRPVVRGKWVTREDVAPFKPDGGITSWSYKCSECGSLSRLKDNFCPNCGADMRDANDEKA